MEEIYLRDLDAFKGPKRCAREQTDAAIGYARFESADRKRVIRLSPDPLELNCSS